MNGETPADRLNPSAFAADDQRVAIHHFAFIIHHL